MKMIFSIRRKKQPHPRKTYLKTLLKRAIELIGLKIDCHMAVAVSFVGPKTIARLKKEFFGIHRLTDVICFDYRENGETLSQNDNVAIDLIICTDVAEERGKELKNSSYAEEMVLYLVHGLLHAAGEKDDQPELKKKMKRRERKIVDSLKKEFDFSKIFPQKRI